MHRPSSVVARSRPCAWPGRSGARITQAAGQHGAAQCARQGKGDACIAHYRPARSRPERAVVHPGACGRWPECASGEAHCVRRPAASASAVRRMGRCVHRPYVVRTWPVRRHAAPGGRPPRRHSPSPVAVRTSANPRVAQLVDPHVLSLLGLAPAPTPTPTSTCRAPSTPSPA